MMYGIMKLIYFRRPKLVENFEGLLDELVAVGIRSLSLGHQMGDVSLLDSDASARAQRLLADRGIEAAAMHGVFRDGYDLNDPDTEHAYDGHRTAITNGAMLGIKTYVMHSGLPVAGRGHADELDAVMAMLRRLLPIAESLDVILALENLPPNYVGHRPEVLTAIIDEIDSPHLKLCFDSGHANMCGDPSAYLDSIAPYVATMHLHDNDGQTDRHQSPCEGTIDWDKLSKAIHRCPNLIHVEIESFNREGHSHAELMALYERLLG